MSATATLIELINKSDITPDQAHPFFVKLVLARPELFVNRYFVFPLVSLPTLKIFSQSIFKNNADVQHHIDVTSNLPEYLLVTTKRRSDLLVCLKSDCLSFIHIFKNGKNYTQSYRNKRVDISVSPEETIKQLSQVFEDIANQRHIMKLVS